MEKAKTAIEDRITVLENIVEQLVNDNEELFYSLLAYKARKKTIEEIVEYSVIQYFGLNRRDFIGKSYKKYGQTVHNFPIEDRNIVDGRKWFVSYMRFILLKNTYTLKLNYPFYTTVMEHSFRSQFMGAISPKTDEDIRNRIILLGISRIIKDTCKSEQVLDEHSDYLLDN